MAGRRLNRAARARRAGRVQCGVWVLPIDVYFVFNLTTDFLLLWATGAWAGEVIRPWRAIAAAAAGALYASAAAWPGREGLAHPALAFAVGCGMVALTYGIEGGRRFVKLVGVFYLAYLSSAGAALAFWVAAPDGGYVGGSSPWLDGRSLIPVAILLVATLGRLLVPAAMEWWERRRRTVDLHLRIGDREATVRALVDTGNHLREPLTGRPVVIAWYEALGGALPEEVRPLFCGGHEPDAEEAVAQAGGGLFADRIAVVPFRTIGRDDGLLFGLRVEARSAAPRASPRPAVVAVVARPVDPEGAYHAICPPELAS